MSSCEKCGILNKPGAKFCKVCGEPITATGAPVAPSCPGCAAPLPSEAKFCKQCGTSVTAPALAPPPNGPEMPQQRAPLPVPKIVAAVCMAAVIAVGGFYFYQRSLAPAVEAVPETAVAPVLTPTQPAPAPAKPVASAKVEVPVRIKPAQRAVAPNASANLNETMARKVSVLLAKANGYVENKQYDKAIATAENVLELDPYSSAAHAMISKAKTRQLEALRTGSTLD